MNVIVWLKTLSLDVYLVYCTSFDYFYSFEIHREVMCYSKVTANFTRKNLKIFL